MLESISAILSSLRQTSPQILIGLTVASGLILFLPDEVATRIGFIDFRNSNRSFIGAALVFSISILTTQFLWFISKGIRQKIIDKRKFKFMVKNLEELTATEKGYLMPYFANDTDTQYFAIDDGVANGLAAKKIIYRSSSVGNMLDGISFNIQPWAKKHILENPHLLEGAGPPAPTPRQRLGLTW